MKSSQEEIFMPPKNVTAVAHLDDNSRNFEYQKRYQRILYKLNIGWLKIVAMGTIYDSEIRRMKRMRIAFLRFSVIASRDYLQIDRKSSPFFFPLVEFLFKRKPQHMYVYDDESI